MLPGARGCSEEHKEETSHHRSSLKHLLWFEDIMFTRAQKTSPLKLKHQLWTSGWRQRPSCWQKLKAQTSWQRASGNRSCQGTSVGNGNFNKWIEKCIFLLFAKCSHVTLSQGWSCATFSIGSKYLTCCQSLCSESTSLLTFAKKFCFIVLKILRPKWCWSRSAWRGVEDPQISNFELLDLEEQSLVAEFVFLPHFETIAHLRTFPEAASCNLCKAK